MYKNYAIKRDKDPGGTTELTHLSKIFKLGLSEYETHHDDAATLIVDNLHIGTHTRMELLEFAQGIKAFTLDYIGQEETYEYLECIYISTDIQNGKLLLKIEVEYVKKFGGKVRKKEILLTKTECHCLAENILYTIQDSSDRGKTLLLSS